MVVTRIVVIIIVVISPLLLMLLLFLLLFFLLSLYQYSYLISIFISSLLTPDAQRCCARWCHDCGRSWKLGRRERAGERTRAHDVLRQPPASSFRSALPKLLGSPCPGPALPEGFLSMIITSSSSSRIVILSISIIGILVLLLLLLSSLRLVWITKDELRFLN